MKLFIYLISILDYIGWNLLFATSYGKVSYKRCIQDAMKMVTR